ncbi:Piso0_000223 [Millerozyma farinosa CBS 7064]|uniref:Endoplasmic reticulum junction formation protein lunapark n=1 Tax=Pichia sorbitophila (strain ATCC MYA-4447 / BCRC 22081 / CBS 7064 / NBRC 10061 / NRRL Y-12695) TaxID=559304 RepID=G8YTE6_PICSO|nr:Piso0_000223 [Millerozyma farinosa CBS 7064]
MGFFTLFGSKSFNPDQFEKELTTITEQISKVEGQLSRIRTKSRNIRHSLSTYLVAIYFIKVAYVYRTFTPALPGSSKIVNLFKKQNRLPVIILVGYPVVAFLLIYLVGYLFGFMASKKEKTLKQLKSNHSKKIEELKKISNYNTTNKLLNKFGDVKQDPVAGSQDSQAEARKSAGVGQPNVGNAPKANPNPLPGTNPLNVQQQGPSKLQAQRHTIPSSGIEAPAKGVKQIQDRLLDFIIGSDNSESIEYRFALICKRCLSHNGLAYPGCSDPMKIVYICPRCGFLNGQADVSMGATSDYATDSPRADEVKTAEASAETGTEDAHAAPTETPTESTTKETTELDRSSSSGNDTAPESS